MAELATLPDYLRPGLGMVSIGLNPSLPSVRQGFYFANPRNRFWRALNASGLLPGALNPGEAAQEYLFETCGIGFTDVVKRPTAGAAELRAADFREGALTLRDKLASYQPAIVWFHGKLACNRFLRYATVGLVAAAWGEQPFRIKGCRVFVTPNPSPANAVYSLDDLIEWYRALRLFRERLGITGRIQVPLQPAVRQS